jgi:hypothetical protein
MFARNPVWASGLVTLADRLRRDVATLHDQGKGAELDKLVKKKLKLK